MTDTQVTEGISTEHPEPLWVQAAGLITDQIARGALAAGARLPSERELCQQLGISRVTLRKALGQLVDDGLLRPSHGRGWYVAPGSAPKEWPNSLESFSETAHRMGLESSSRVLRAVRRPATFDEAESLQIAPGASIFQLERVRRLAAMPVAVDSTEIPLDYVGDMGAVDFSVASLYDELAGRGIAPARADATIEAQQADGALAELLGLEAGKPVLVMRQVAYDEAERPLFVSTIRYAGDRYRLRTSFARHVFRARELG